MAYNIDVSQAKRHDPLPTRVYPVPAKAKSGQRAAVLTLPLDLLAGETLDTGLERILRDDFNKEIQGGQTYPQEHAVSEAGFRSYFLTYDLVVGLFLSGEQLSSLAIDFTQHSDKELFAGVPLSTEQKSKLDLGNAKLISSARADTEAKSVVLTDWSHTYAFSYYIKPNYPGRSAHLCNGGFMVPGSSRGLGLGQIAGRSFLYYAPGCGYRGSVFNLVYTTNIASLRIWEGLGFRTVGILPEAGRLRTGDGDGEAYADAAIVHGDFRKIGLYEGSGQVPT